MASQKPKSNPKKKPRVRPQATYKSFRLSKKIKHSSNKPLPGIWRLLKQALLPLRQHKKLFIGIMVINFGLSIIFASVISSSIDFVSVKDELNQAFGGELDKVTSATTLFAYLLNSAGGQAGGSNYQLFITLITSLATIWAIRQVLAGERIRVRQAFYQGMYPLVPFMLVLFVIALQLLPFLIGSSLLSTVIQNGLAISGAEQAVWWVVFGLLSLLSLYLVLSSIFALYISTLPNMTPIKALRSARGLVLHRRLSVGLRLLGLPIVLGIIYFGVLVPLIFLVPVLVVPAFLAVGSFSLVLTHSYLYNLYRALL